MSTVLELRDLAVAYGGVLAVRGVSLSVEAGSIATVIGANGAGKSTLLNAIMGILPSQGHIGFAGVSLEGLPVEARVAAGLGLVPEKRELFSSMSVEDNLRLGAFLRRAEGRSAIAASLLLCNSRWTRPPTAVSPRRSSRRFCTFGSSTSSHFSTVVPVSSRIVSRAELCNHSFRATS